MRPDGADFATAYAGMYDAELIEVARSYDSLTEVAQAAIRAEFARRGLEPPIVEVPNESPVWNELVTVGRYRDLTEVEVAQSALESAGIEAFVPDAHVVTMNWAWANALGGIRLQVAARDEQSAIEVLAQSVPEEIVFAENETFQQPRCPQCGSKEITFQGTSRGLAIASLYAFSLPLPQGRETWSCSSCGARWEQTED
jgi:predicted RNA-binding Zn-ribbon protein involved in translation (DUF1610 family)